MSCLFPLTLLDLTESLPFDSTSCSITRSVVSHLKVKSKTPGSPDSILADLFRIFVVESSAKYKRITKEVKDPKGLYAIDRCSTKLLSK